MQIRVLDGFLIVLRFCLFSIYLFCNVQRYIQIIINKNFDFVYCFFSGFQIYYLPDSKNPSWIWGLLPETCGFSSSLLDIINLVHQFQLSSKDPSHPTPPPPFFFFLEKEDLPPLIVYFWKKWIWFIIQLCRPVLLFC